MPISLTLDDQQSERLEAVARKLGVAPEALVTLAVNDLLARPDNDFLRTAEHVLQKNQELYRRLS
jgi:hypothetical protein